MTLGEFLEKEYHHEYKQSFELHKVRLTMSVHCSLESGERMSLKDIVYIPMFDDNIIEVANKWDGNIENLPKYEDMFPD
jgi:hypothetical protein